MYFQEFEDYRDADDAVYELNGKDLCGERLVTIEHYLTNPFTCISYWSEQISLC